VVGRALLLEEDVTDPRLAASLAKLRVAAERCGKIVKTFLAMARAKPQQRRPVSANVLIGAALDLAGYGLRSGGVEVVRDLAPDLPPVSADEDQLHQVFLNPLVNAQQALRDAPPPRRILITTRREADQVRIDIADTGPGIPPALRSRVFEPFFTTKPAGAGTGIGLSFCHAVVTAHDGAIEAGERPGGGALFTVRLPATEAVAPAAHAAAAGSRPMSARILVVDDEPDILALLDEILSGDGHTIEHAASGREALERVAAQSFDLVISDVRMPDGDGRDLYRALRAQQPALAERMLVLTGDTLGLAPADLPGLPREALLEKPVEPAALRRAVRTILAGPRSGAAR
jgi:two-component system NtrC family sensor kinase